jgi:hypothetical protein
LAITADAEGNVYALWIRNTKKAYEIVMRVRSNGKWGKIVKIGSGTETVKSPDMVIDKHGRIHVAYIKRTPEWKAGCYYLAVDRAELLSK